MGYFRWEEDGDGSIRVEGPDGGTVGRIPPMRGFTMVYRMSGIDGVRRSEEHQRPLPDVECAKRLMNEIEAGGVRRSRAMSELRRGVRPSTPG